MSLLDLRPNLRPFSAGDYWAAAARTEPRTSDVLGAGFTEGVMTSFGLGTALREGQTPDLVTPEPVEDFRGNSFTRTGRAPTPETIDADQWAASEFARDGLKWEPGMTRERAAAIADFHDASQYRQMVLSSAKGGAYAVGIAGQFLGAATDPINYIPVLGPATRAAAVAKFGLIGGSAAVAAGDAAINTAVAGVATARSRAAFGDDVSWTAFATDVALGALIGGAFGGGVGAWQKLRANRQANALPRVGEAQRALSEAVGDVVAGRPVQLSDATVAAMRRDGAELTPTLWREQIADVEFPAERVARPASLTEFIARAGGIRDEGGELVALGLTGEGVGRGANLRRGYGSLINRRGMDFDQAREMAEEAGYIARPNDDTTSSVNDFIDALGREARGERVYSVRDEAEVAEYQRLAALAADNEAALARFDDADARISDAAEEMGVILSPAERDVVRQAVNDFGMAPDDAIESAIRGSERGLFMPRAVDDFTPPPFFADEIAAAEAASRVGSPLRGEQAFADDLGIDLETGDSVAMLELEQLRQAGRITEAEEAMLAEIDADAARADAIGEALKAAAACRMV